jgi:hypothetical protein
VGYSSARKKKLSGIITQRLYQNGITGNRLLCAIVNNIRKTGFKFTKKTGVDQNDKNE